LPFGAHESPAPQVPQLPPQPSSPQVRALQSGVQAGESSRRE
jgi:hypothetical protein